MDTISPLENAIRHVGLAPMAKALDLLRIGRFAGPFRAGKSALSLPAAQRLSDGRVTRDELLNWGKPRPELVTEDHPAPESREEAA